MKPEEIKALERLCPEMAEVFTGKGLTIELDVNTIAACIVKLGEENEALREKQDAEIDAAYRCGKEDGERIGYEAGRKERG